MSPLAALALATPIFGLSLQVPALQSPMAPLAAVAAPSSAALVPTAALRGPLLAQLDEAEEGADAQELDREAYKAQLRERNELVELHRPLGIATWVAMTTTVVLGFIQYYNLYGFFADQGDNPCVQGDAIFGQSTCSGFPWPHALSAALTTGLYGATFTVSLMMPDPDDLSSGDSEFASTLRMHKLLRWVHLSGMIAQIVLGVIVANDVVGDRANDYGTLQTLATVHLATGIVTYGALTWAGALMVF